MLMLSVDESGKDTGEDVPQWQIDHVTPALWECGSKMPELCHARPLAIQCALTRAYLLNRLQRT
jgi:hypothetical protein